MKLQTLVQEFGLLQELLEKPLPIKVAYRLKRIYDNLLPELKTYEEKKLEIFKKYGEKKDETKDIYTLKTENIEIANKELADLGELDIKEPEIKADISELKNDIEPKYLLEWAFNNFN